MREKVEFSIDSFDGKLFYIKRGGKQREKQKKMEKKKLKEHNRKKINCLKQKKYEDQLYNLT